MDGSADTALPGFEGWVSDLQQRAQALGEDDIPTAWTPEHVGARLIEAFDTLMRSGLTVGPRQYGNAWPAMLKEFADLIDADASRNRAEEFMASRNRPNSAEVSRMNEALLWPFRYLDGRVLASDSLMLWAFATAAGRDMSRMLHHRKRRAQALAEEMMRRHNAPPHVVDGVIKDTRDRAVLDAYERRREIAREVAATMPAAEALAVFRARCRDAGCLPLVVKPYEAVPGRALSRTTLDRQRKIAMAAIADGLRRSDVPVR